RAALHGERLTRVVREDEHRRVVGRVIAPPAAPGLVGPRAAHGTEHVAPEDPGADIPEPARHEVIVHAALATLAAEQLACRSRGKHPLVQRVAAHAQGLVAALVRTGAVAVDRHRESVYAQ